MQHGADVGVALLVHADLLLVIGLAQEGQGHTVAAQRRLDDVGDVMLVAILVVVLQGLTGGLLMAAQVIIGAVSDAPQLAPAAAEGLDGDSTDKIYSGLTSYWARHTWATLAAELEIPKETIAKALGHGGNEVTDVYIRFDDKKIDIANRRVIDYLNEHIKNI